MKMYVSHDVKANIWSVPIAFESEEALQQYLSVLVNSHSNGHYHLYPEDYVFYCIGEWNEDRGVFNQYEEKQFAVNLVGLRRQCKACPQEELANEPV